MHIQHEPSASGSGLVSDECQLGAMTSLCFAPFNLETLESEIYINKQIMVALRGMSQTLLACLTCFRGK